MTGTLNVSQDQVVDKRQQKPQLVELQLQQQKQQQPQLERQPMGAVEVLLHQQK
jgi:hypothetical protein